MAGLGNPLVQASFFIRLLTGGQAAGTALGYAIGDRFDKRHVAAWCRVAHAAGLPMLTFATGTRMLVVFAALHGVAWGVRGPFMQAIRADCFGRHAIGMIMGLSAAVIALGQVGAPLVAGAMADAFGNYRAGFTLLAGVAGLGSLLLLAARKPH